MIADFPLAAAAQVDTVAAKTAAFLERARALSADGLSWAEFGSLLVSLMRLSVEAMDTIGSMTGAEKKAAAMAAAAALFDLVADKAVPVAAWPVWILVRPAVRSLVLAIASGAVEAILPLVRGE